MPKLALASSTTIFDFENGSQGWNKGIITSGSSSSGAIRLSNNNNDSIESKKVLDAPALRGMTSLTLDVNLNGNKILDRDASAIVFDQSGWKMVSLKNYLQNGTSGWQHVTIPLADFTGLNTDQGVATMIIRFWNNAAGNYDIDNIAVSNGNIVVPIDEENVVNSDEGTTPPPVEQPTESTSGNKIADFNTGRDGFDRGTVSNQTLELNNPSNGDASSTKIINSPILQNHENVELDVNLNGNYILDGDAGAVIFDQAGPKMAALKNYVNNGAAGWQHIKIPLDDFTGLNKNNGVASLSLRIWNYMPGRYQIDNIHLTGASSGNTSQNSSNINDPVTPPAAPIEETSTPQSGNNWQVKSIDSQVMSKYWKIGDEGQIRALVKADKSLGAKQIAVGINYDYPDLLQKWADIIHSEGLNVWYRGHWDEWDSWEKSEIKNGITDEEYLARTKKFILDHPSLFREGDSFTMAVESENAAWHTGIDPPAGGGPFSGWEDWREFTRQQVTESNDAFNKIGLGDKVKTNWINMNGWVAWNQLDQATVNTLGQLTLDHIIDNVDDTNTYAHQLFKGDGDGFYGYDDYYNKWHVPMIAGEWGYSTWNPNIDPKHQQELADAILQEFKSRSYILGINYWIDVGHASKLFDNDRDLHVYTPRPIANTIKQFYA